jgi:hypothetical protein
MTTYGFFDGGANLRQHEPIPLQAREIRGRVRPRRQPDGEMRPPSSHANLDGRIPDDPLAARARRQPGERGPRRHLAPLRVAALRTVAKAHPRRAVGNQDDLFDAELGQPPADARRELLVQEPVHASRLRHSGPEFDFRDRFDLHLLGRD